MKQLALVNIVGLSKRCLGEETPFITQWAKQRQTAVVEPVLPAVTCSVQSTYLTGKWPREHGIVGNGWYFRDECEVKLWRQSNKLVQAPKIWEIARSKQPDFTCANLFWWYNMYSSVDYGVTPRPQYLADGRKLPDCYSQPPELREWLQNTLGTFPLFDFWGPKTSIKSSQWIAEASKMVHDRYQPTLTLIYLPHLDYALQKFGHDRSRIGKDLKEIDGVVKDLVEFFEEKNVQVNLISEYGITEVRRPIHINRILRESGLIRTRLERGTELLDPGISPAFALADHQVAHIYVQDPAMLPEIRAKLERVDGIEMVLDETGKKQYHIDHPRAGELIAVADADSWFTYYYWEDDDRAPDFARMVDIHKKPGYDPVEMFLDPHKKFILPRVALKLMGKKLGFRTLMNVIPLDASLVRGSHGRIHLSDADKAIFIGNSEGKSAIAPTSVCDLLLRQML